MKSFSYFLLLSYLASCIYVQYFCQLLLSRFCNSDIYLLTEKNFSVYNSHAQLTVVGISFDRKKGIRKRRNTFLFEIRLAPVFSMSYT